MYATLTTRTPKGAETTKTITHLQAADTIRRLEEQRGYDVFIAGDGTAFITFPNGWGYILKRYFSPEYW